MFTYFGADLEEFSDQGVSETELRAVMSSGKATRFDPVDNTKFRFAKQTAANQVAVIGSAGKAGQANPITKAWEWTMPANPGAASLWGVEDALKVEQVLYQAMDQLQVIDLPRESIFTNFADPEECAAGEQVLPLTFQSNGVRATGDQPLQVEPCIFSSLTAYLSHNQDLNDWGTFQDRVDSVLSEVLWAHSKLEAGQGNSPRQLNWFYDNNPSTTDPPKVCAALPVAQRDIRRCNPYADNEYWSNWNNQHNSVDYGSYIYAVNSPARRDEEGTATPGGRIARFQQLDNYLSTRGMDWNSAGASNYYDLVASETRVAPRQLDWTEFPSTTGKTWQEAAAAKMASTLANVPQSGMHAEVWVFADIYDPGAVGTNGRAALIDFRT